MVDNILPKSQVAGIQPCPIPVVRGNKSEDSQSFWTRASITSLKCCSISINLAGKPNFVVHYDLLNQMFQVRASTAHKQIITFLFFKKKIIKNVDNIVLYKLNVDNVLIY